MAERMVVAPSIGIKLGFLIPSLLLCSCLSAATVVSAPSVAISLRVSCFSDQSHKFFVQLLQSALASANQSAHISCVNDLPGRRMWKMIDDGKLDLIWGMQTPDKDRRLVPIRIDLTDGLAGQRVLLIRPEDQKIFDRVTSISTLRDTGLVAGFGEGWFDATVWKQNRLPFYESPHRFSLIYPMVTIRNRGIDYLPRGVNEVVTEARAHKALSIEHHLLLSYDRDMRFYLAPRLAGYQRIIEDALKAAEVSGLKRRIIDQTFESDIKVLDLTRRRRIQLLAPPID